MKKYDLILYNGEEILELRLSLMYKYVDYFVIVEFDKTSKQEKKCLGGIFYVKEMRKSDPIMKW